MALLPGRPHNSGLDTMTCSLMAKSAQAPAHSGVALALLSPQASLELCTIALHRTVVVYRAYSWVVLVRLTLEHPRIS